MVANCWPKATSCQYHRTVRRIRCIGNIGPMRPTGLLCAARAGIIPSTTAIVQTGPSDSALRVEYAFASARIVFPLVPDTDSMKCRDQASNRWLWLMLLAYAVVCAVVWLWMRNTDVTQTLVIALTGVAVIWSAVETQKLRQAAHDQIEAQLSANDLQTRPLVVLRADTTRDVVHVENIGRGPALNTRIEPADLRMGGDDDEPVNLTFGGLPAVILPAGIADARVDAFLFGTSVGDFYNYALNPDYALHPIRITIRYEDIQLKTYRICQTIEPGSMKTTAIEVLLS